MLILSTVFKPAGLGESYLVVASAVPDIPSHFSKSSALPLRRKLVADGHGLADLCCELAQDVRRIAEHMGHSIRGIDCSHCPNRQRPACGALAIVRNHGLK